MENEWHIYYNSVQKREESGKYAENKERQTAEADGENEQRTKTVPYDPSIHAFNVCLFLCAIIRMAVCFF